MTSLESLLKPYLNADTVFGLVGVGCFGTKIRNLVAPCVAEILLCDPPKSLDDADMLNDALHIEWGNGMGGCNFSDISTDTYLPLTSLARADVISIQVPLNDTTRGMITAGFMEKCTPNTRILCFSPIDVLAQDIRTDARLILCSEVFT